MKIGIEFGNIAFGGGERILMMLASSFAKRGNEVIIFTWNKAWADFKDWGFDHQLYVLRHIPKWGNGLFSLYELNKIVRNNRIDCMISFLGAPTRVFSCVGKLNRIPVITSIRIEPHYETLIGKAIKGILWSCDGAVFQTETVRNFFTGRIFRNSTVIHNPLMDDDFPYVDMENYKKEIVGIGRLMEQKNFELLINAFAKAKIDDYVLKIYGEGPLRPNLQKQIEDLNMTGKVFLMGQVERVVDEIKNADIFVLSSDWEGMPNALLESMAMGLACVATDVATGGARELIQDGENGILVPIQDESRLSEAIVRIVKDTELKQKIKANAIRVRESHSKEVIIPQWISFIESKIK